MLRKLQLLLDTDKKFVKYGAKRADELFWKIDFKLIERQNDYWGHELITKISKMLMWKNKEKWNSDIFARYFVNVYNNMNKKYFEMYKDELVIWLRNIETPECFKKEFEY